RSGSASDRAVPGGLLARGEGRRPGRTGLPASAGLRDPSPHDPRLDLPATSPDRRSLASSRAGSLDPTPEKRLPLMTSATAVRLHTGTTGQFWILGGLQILLIAAITVTNVAMPAL